MRPRPASPAYGDGARGKPKKPYVTPKGLKAEQAWQLAQLARSVKYCKKLGLGLQ